jgi:signal transduction histidine kinase/CheY-like chemotaxis protein
MQDAEKVNILLVDDRPENLLALEATLDSLGQNLIRASSGMEALKHLLREEFAVVLLDVQMPVMNGFETATLIKQREKTAHIPIIFVTANSKDEQHVFQGYLAGAVDYIAKPFDPYIMRSKVAVFVDLFKKSRQVLAQAELLHAAEQRLREAEARKALETFSHNIVKTMREPLLTLDAALCVRGANRAYYQTFGVSPQETEGRYVYELGDGQWDIPALRTRLEECLHQASGFHDFEVEQEFPTIGPRVMLLNGRQLRTADQQEMLVLAMEDVTEQRRAREQEIAFTRELQESYQRLQEMEKLRDDLTHMIIHDLRTPLTSLIAGMQTLEVAGTLNEEQREVMQISQESGEILLGMINELLDVEKMESGTMTLDFAQISPVGLVARAVDQVSALAESKRLSLVQDIAPDLPPFEGDETKLLRTLVNLMGNAIKFTPPGGSVTVEASCCEEAQTVQFSVRDTGEGIPAEAFELIFEKFGQVKSRQAGRVMSTGLGLTFCKLAVEAHGGQIGVESTLGQGSRFCYSIPVTPFSTDFRVAEVEAETVKASFS